MKYLTVEWNDLRSMKCLYYTLPLKYSSRGENCESWDRWIERLFWGIFICASITFATEDNFSELFWTIILPTLKDNFR